MSYSSMNPILRGSLAFVEGATGFYPVRQAFSSMQRGHYMNALAKMGEGAVHFSVFTLTSALSMSFFGAESKKSQSASSSEEKALEDYALTVLSTVVSTLFIAGWVMQLISKIRSIEPLMNYVYKVSTGRELNTRTYENNPPRTPSSLKDYSNNILAAGSPSNTRPHLNQGSTFSNKWVPIPQGRRLRFDPCAQVKYYPKRSPFNEQYNRRHEAEMGVEDPAFALKPHKKVPLKPPGDVTPEPPEEGPNFQENPSAKKELFK
ncbi:MAG: hypothetical protein S4CHLAM7_06720 [Chlamydiae bacterium]|nr:hypothetical protein [Chlamydiota bacterium]